MTDQKFLQDIRKNTITLIQTVKDTEIEYKATNLTKTKCPMCKEPMLLVKGKKGKLTEDQETFFQSWKGAVQVFRDVEDVINFFAPSGLLANEPMLDFSDIK